MAETMRAVTADRPGAPEVLEVRDVPISGLGVGQGRVAVRSAGVNFHDIQQRRGMTNPKAAGQRFLGTGPFAWLADIAAVLREGLGPRASNVPKRIAPNVLIRLIARFDQSLKPVIGELGQESQYSTEKARRLLGWAPRPARESILDCATSILDHQAG